MIKEPWDAIGRLEDGVFANINKGILALLGISILSQLITRWRQVLDWMIMWDDPLATKRLSIVLTCVVFLVIMFAIFRLARWGLSKIMGKELLDAFAMQAGYKDSKDIIMQFTHLATWFSCIFLAGVMLYFFFTNYSEMKQVYSEATYSGMVEQCEHMNGSIACIPSYTLGLSKDYLSINWSKGSTINYSINTTKDIK